jgi:hypothetical protein
MGKIMTSFVDLQNGLYNLIQEALGLTNASNFQLIQPGVSFPSGTTDATVWSWMNNIPPLALSQSGSGGDQFFSDYEVVMSALSPTVNINFEGDIGTTVFNDWLSYVSSLANQPSASQLPSLFFSWAYATGHYSVAAKGSSDLSAMILEPIYRAQLELQPYVTIQGVSQGKPPDWSLGYTDLVSQVGGAPAKSASITNVQSSNDVSGSWAAGGSSGGFLLWGGESSSSKTSISQNFASQAVSLSVNFAHALNFVPTPGAWYDSGAFGLAYSTQSGLPWNPTDSTVTWAKTFGPNGDLQRFASSLIVVSGMNVTATSSYSFSSSEQTTITQNSHLGFWPFYSSGSNSTVTTTHTFNASGQLTISQSSPVNDPVLIGMLVAPAGAFLGYATSGTKTILQGLQGMPILSQASGLTLDKILSQKLAA